MIVTNARNIQTVLLVQNSANRTVPLLIKILNTSSADKSVPFSRLLPDKGNSLICDNIAIFYPDKGSVDALNRKLPVIVTGDPVILTVAPTYN